MSKGRFTNRDFVFQQCVKSSTCPLSQVCRDMKWLAMMREAGWESDFCACSCLQSTVTLVGISSIPQGRACLSDELCFQTSCAKTSLSLLGAAPWQGDRSSRRCPAASQRMVACLGGEGKALHGIKVRDEELSKFIFPPSDLCPVLEAVASTLIRANPIKLVLLELEVGPCINWPQKTFQWKKIVTIKQ